VATRSVTDCIVRARAGLHCPHSHAWRAAQTAGTSRPRSMSLSEPYRAEPGHCRSKLTVTCLGRSGVRHQPVRSAQEAAAVPLLQAGHPRVPSHCNPQLARATRICRHYLTIFRTSSAACCECIRMNQQRCRPDEGSVKREVAASTHIHSFRFENCKCLTFEKLHYDGGSLTRCMALS